MVARFEAEEQVVEFYTDIAGRGYSGYTFGFDLTQIIPSKTGETRIRLGDVFFSLRRVVEELFEIPEMELTARHYYPMVFLSDNVESYASDDVKIKITNSKNPYLDKILDKCLEVVRSHLEKREKGFRLGVYLYRDPEIPEWEVVTIWISTEYENFEEEVNLWDEIEKKIENIFKDFKSRAETNKQLKQIEEVNQILTTTIDKIK